MQYRAIQTRWLSVCQGCLQIPSGSAECIEQIPSALVAATAKSTLLPALNAKAEFNNVRNQAREVRCDLALTEMKEKGGGSIGTATKVG